MLEKLIGRDNSTDEDGFIHFVIFAAHFFEDDGMPIGVPLLRGHVIFPCPSSQAQFLDQIHISR